VETTYRVKCLTGFLDGNVIPRRLKPGEILEVDERTYKKLVGSDPDGFEVLEAVRKVPPPTKSKAKDDAKAT